MKYPLVAVVCCYAAGLLLASLFQPPLLVLYALSFFIFGSACLYAKSRPLLLGPLLVLAGWTNLVCQTAIVSPNDLRAQLGSPAAIASVRGTLTETPKIKISNRGGEPAEHSLATVSVDELQNGKNWQPAFGKIVVMTPSALPENFFAGQRVEISGVLTRPPQPLADGLFDYRDHLQTRGIYYELKTGSTNDWQLLAPVRPQPPLTDRFLDWSQRTLALGLPAEDEPLRLLWAMTLGWRTAFTGDISEPYLRAGTMHLFAIDGLRIALISGMLVALLRVLQLSRAWCGFIAIPAIWFYTAATGWESPAVRASVMMTVVIGGWALQRPASLINSLAAAAFIILLWEPRQLFEAGFQLSFLVVLIIGLLLPKLNRITDGWLQSDPLLPEELAPRWRRALLSGLRLLARYCSLSFAAWIGSIPLSAKYFHLFSPVSTPANIIAVPLGTLALMSNLGALVCGAWFPWATELFNHAAWFFMSAMTAVSEWYTKIPGAYFYVSEPSWTSILLYYLILIVLLSSWLKTIRRQMAAAAILILIAMVYLWRWEQSRGETALTILPLGGGHAVWVDADGQKNDWLVNCGDEDAVAFTVKPFLRAHGVNQIPRLALTVGDTRNIGGTQSLDELFNIGELFTSPVRFRSPAYRDAVAAFDRPPARHKIIKSSDVIRCWQALYPDATNTFSRADDNALVLRGSLPGADILLLSDLGRDGQGALLATTNDLRADIVVAGLTNDGEPLCNALVAAVQPKIIIIADSEFPANRCAGRSLKARLEQTRIPVIYTRDAGGVKIVTNQSGWKLQTMDGQTFDSRKDGRLAN